MNFNKMYFNNIDFNKFYEYLNDNYNARLFYGDLTVLKDKLNANNGQLTEEEKEFLKKGILYSVDTAKWVLDNMDEFQEYCSASLLIHNELNIELLKEYEPETLWYPKIPTENTLREALKIRNNETFICKVAKACIIGRYLYCFNSLNVCCDKSLLNMCRERSTQVFLDVLMDKFYDSKYMGDVLGIGHIDAPDNESEFLKVYEKEMENYNKPLESKSKNPDL